MRKMRRANLHISPKRWNPINEIQLNWFSTSFRALSNFMTRIDWSFYVLYQPRTCHLLSLKKNTRRKKLAGVDVSSKRLGANPC